jgi:hypothetical protein
MSRIGMRNDKQDWRQHEKGDERQFDIEKRQFDRVFEQKILMRDGARRDGDIEQDKEIAQPKSRADGGRVLDGFAERVEVMRLFGELFAWVGSVAGFPARAARARENRHSRSRFDIGSPPSTHRSTGQAHAGAKAASIVQEPRRPRQ